MTPAPVGYQCPICMGRAREGSFGAASYRTRSAVGRQVDRVPLVRLLKRSGVTQALIAANVAVFVVMLVVMLVRRASFDNPRLLFDFGALYAPLPRSQWWRLITAMFVHIGPLHILFNMYALAIFGPAIESRYGRARYLAMYLAAGFLGSASSVLLTRGGGPRAGASGAVFGILGAWIAFFVRHRSARGARDQLRSLLFLVAINFFIGVTFSNIDNNAHLGGLVGGFVIGTALEQSVRRRNPAEQQLIGLAGYALVIAGGLWALIASGRFISVSVRPSFGALAVAISSASFCAIRPRWRGERITSPPKRSGGFNETCISQPQPENGITTTSAVPRERPECQTPL